jgi:hypothetical protein
MRINFQIAWITLGTSVWLMPLAASADGQAVAPTSFERTASPTQEVQFGRRAAQVGDQIDQALDVRFELEAISRRGNEIIEQKKTEMRRGQRRVLTTADVKQGRMVAARLQYASARKWSGPAGEVPSADALPGEPVEGKTYHCRREGERLVVTDGEGQLPPLAEFEIVALNMETLGKPNPLAEFFAGRTMTVGQQVAVPPEVADELFGLSKQFGEIVRFDLRLDEVTDMDGERCAVFTATIDAEGARSSQMRMSIQGTLTMQAATCRMARAELNGPIAMAETRGSLSNKYQLNSRGRLTVALRSRYQDIDDHSSAIQ